MISLEVVGEISIPRFVNDINGVFYYHGENNGKYGEWALASPKTLETIPLNSHKSQQTLPAYVFSDLAEARARGNVFVWCPNGTVAHNPEFRGIKYVILSGQLVEPSAHAEVEAKDEKGTQQNRPLETENPLERTLA